MLFGSLCLTFKKLLNTLPKQQCHLTFLSVMYGISIFSTSLPTLGNVPHFDSSHSCGFVMVYHLAFIYISLMTNDVEHHFICLSSICISSL